MLKSMGRNSMKRCQPGNLLFMAFLKVFIFLEPGSRWASNIWFPWILIKAGNVDVKKLTDHYLIFLPLRFFKKTQTTTFHSFPACADLLELPISQSCFVHLFFSLFSAALELLKSCELLPVLPEQICCPLIAALQTRARVKTHGDLHLGHWECSWNTKSEKNEIKNLFSPVLSLAVYLWLPSAALGIAWMVEYWRLRINI